MDNACGQDGKLKDRERGAARLKFILIIALIAIVAYIGFQYVPVAYQASRFKTAMQDSVDKAATLGQPTEWLRTQLKAEAGEYNVPPEAVITIERSGDGRVQARVEYTRPIAFPGYTYSYKFDHTVKSTQLFSSK
jgi:hypothetical protein